jgi:hypothetical protein
MSSEPPETTPAAGWYEDPHGPGLRWWDGSEWTEHTLDEAPEPPAEAEAEPERAPDPEPEPEPGPSSGAPGAPDADALMAMYGARPVGIKREREEPSHRGYQVLLGLLLFGLIAIIAGLLIVGGGSDGDGVTLGGDTGALDAAADAQALARTAQTAIETYSADHAGSYEGATTDALVGIEPTLSDADLEVAAAASGYTVTVSTPEGDYSYSISGDQVGNVTFSCTTEGTPGCPPGGDWSSGTQQPF